MNPARVDFIVDLAYGLMIFVAVMLIAFVGTTIGVAFGLGVLVSYAIHVGWKMARFDPDWMTQEVTENVEETLRLEVEAVIDRLEEVNDRVDRRPRTDEVEQTVDETVGEVTEEVEETVDRKVGEVTEEVGRTVEETVGETVEKTVEETVGETVEQTVGETVEKTVEETMDETVEETVEKTVEETMDEAVEDKMDETVDETVEKKVEAAVKGGEADDDGTNDDGVDSASTDESDRGGRT